MSQERGQHFLLELPSLRHELPFSPKLLSTLYNQTDPSAVTPLDEIAECLSRDQGLTAKVLTMANSAFYGLQQQVTTVDRALAVLGLHEVRSLVLAMGVKGLTHTPHFPKDFHLKPYWEHQLSVGLIGRMLAQAMGRPDGDTLFTAGILHDLGKLLTALYRVDDWRIIEKTVKTQSIAYSEAEEEYWGLEHGVVGSMVMGSWNLPLELTEPVNWHHAPLHSPSHRRQALTLYAADAMAHALVDDQTVVRCPWREVMKTFRLDGDDMLAQAEALLLQHDPGVFADDLAA